MMPRKLLLLAFLLLVAGCSSTDTPTASPETSTTALAQSGTTTTSTVDPTSSFMPEPPAAAGIWMVDFAGSILQFRLDAGPDDKVTGVFDSVSEGVTDVPVDVTIEDSTITLEIPAAQAIFEGVVDNDTISGVWMQAGAEIPMVFARQAEPFVLSRSQEPQPPYPYEATDVVFNNDDAVLAGTLIVPDGDGPFPAAVLISGSGSQDRDESLAGHKPFWILADSLARRGVATLRFDDRGVGASTGDPTGATTEDLATDTTAAADFLAEQPNIGDIGLIGHSEGGMIAPIVTLDSPTVAFVVLLAGPGLPGAEILQTQTGDLMRAEGVPESAIEWRMGWNEQVIALSASESDSLEVARAIEDVMTASASDAPIGMEGLASDVGIEETVQAFTDPWMRFFLAYDPVPALEEMDVPVLAMIGELDLQVSAAANIPALETALSANGDATVLSLPGLNHLFQNATTGAVSEYGQIEETFDTATLGIIADWILERF